MTRYQENISCKYICTLRMIWVSYLVCYNFSVTKNMSLLFSFLKISCPFPNVQHWHWYIWTVFLSLDLFHIIIIINVVFPYPGQVNESHIFFCISWWNNSAFLISKILPSIYVDNDTDIFRQYFYLVYLWNSQKICSSLFLLAIALPFPGRCTYTWSRGQKNTLRTLLPTITQVKSYTQHNHCEWTFWKNWSAALSITLGLFCAAAALLLQLLGQRFYILQRPVDRPFLAQLKMKWQVWILGQTCRNTKLTELLRYLFCLDPSSTFSFGIFYRSQV